MNNRDRFEQAMRSDPLEAAALAIQFSGGCGSKAAAGSWADRAVEAAAQVSVTLGGSKAAAWSWADRAVEAAAQVSVTLDAGHASWPNLNAMTDQLAAAKTRKPETVIVSRHAGAVAWLAQRGIAGAVIAQATPEDVRGKNVIGNLPLHLAALARRVGSIDLPRLAAADRGRDLTPEEMDAAGATIRWYVVEAVQP